MEVGRKEATQNLGEDLYTLSDWGASFEELCFLAKSFEKLSDKRLSKE
jgi:hypothetical protein